MSDFRIKAVTQTDVNCVRQSTGLGAYEARRALERDNLEAAIHAAKDVEDLKVCLLSLLHRVR